MCAMMFIADTSIVKGCLEIMCYWAKFDWPDWGMLQANQCWLVRFTTLLHYVEHHLPTPYLLGRGLYNGQPLACQHPQRCRITSHPNDLMQFAKGHLAPQMPSNVAVCVAVQESLVWDLLEVLQLQGHGLVQAHHGPQQCLEQCWLLCVADDGFCEQFCWEWVLDISEVHGEFVCQPPLVLVCHCVQYVLKWSSLT